MSKRKYAVQLACIVLGICINYAYTVSAEEPKQPGQETVSSKEFTYQIGPIPAFVYQLAPEPTEEKEAKDQGDAVLVLYQHQVSLLGNVPEEFVRLESKPLTSSALQDVSQVFIRFNPAYQKLLLHRIRVWRDGKAIDLTHSVKLDLMRRENDLEKNMYEGNVTAVGVLPDIRVDDVIDVEYTVSGANPIFGNRFAELLSMTLDKPVDSYLFSLVTPVSRPVKVQPPQGVSVKETQENGVIRYMVEKAHLKPLVAEDNMPYWHLPLQLVQISEYQDWPQVSSWANNLFKVDGALSPEIEKQIQNWKDANLPKDQIAVEVLRWVQSQVRYFGIELGVNSHLPAPPNLTVERKFGDCKDKSLLLVSLLRALGIDAEPVLASMGLRRNIEHMTPSPALFDHAIVRVQINGKTYWLDPTRPPQYGKLDTLGITDFGAVLPLGKASSQLQPASYPPGFESLYEEDDHFNVSAFNQPVQLTRQIKANFGLAETLRYAHDKQSKEEFNKNLQGVILRVYPKAQAIGDALFVDDKINNQVTITFKYAIDDYFKYEPGQFTGVFIAAELLGWTNLPKVAQRASPFALPEHFKVTQSIEFDYPNIPTTKESNDRNTKSGEFWTLTSSHEIQSRNMRFSWALSANREAVPAQKISEFITETRTLREHLSGSIRLPVGILTDEDKHQILKSTRRLQSTYGESSSGRVGAELRDATNLIRTTKDIESGKLGGKQLAEAYKIRSQAYDDQAKVQQALGDIRAAEKLIPDNFDYIASEAETLLGDGQFAAAKQAYELAIKVAKSTGADETDDLRGYGEVLHYLGENAKAKAVLDEAIKRSNGKGAMYSAIWRFIASGHEADAASSLQSTMNGIQDRAWPYAIGDMLLDEITPEQLIKAAGSSDKGTQEDQYCEAYYYIGQKYLLDDNKAKAEESFQKSLDQGVMLFIENDLALYELGKKREPKKEGFWSLF